MKKVREKSDNGDNTLDIIPEDTTFMRVDDESESMIFQRYKASLLSRKRQSEAGCCMAFVGSILSKGIDFSVLSIFTWTLLDYIGKPFAFHEFHYLGFLLAALATVIYTITLLIETKKLSRGEMVLEKGSFAFNFAGLLLMMGGCVVLSVNLLHSSILSAAGPLIFTVATLAFFAGNLCAGIYALKQKTKGVTFRSPTLKKYNLYFFNLIFLIFQMMGYLAVCNKAFEFKLMNVGSDSVNRNLTISFIGLGMLGVVCIMITHHFLERQDNAVNITALRNTVSVQPM